jgi:hypothetical protein
MNIGDFALHNRKNSAYIPRNELHSATNRKISAYFTFAGYPMKDKTSYNFYLKNPRKPHLDALRNPIIKRDCLIGSLFLYENFH